MGLTVFIIGMSGILMQTLLMRKLLSVLSGNELHLGITLSIWLLSSGAGALIGRRLKREILPLLLFITGMISPLSFVIIDLIRPLSHLIPGEALSLGGTIFWTFVIVCPVSLLYGFLFSSSLIRWNRGPVVFAVEAFGAFAGGLLFVYIFSGRINSLWISLFAGVMSFFAGFWLSKKKGALILLFFYPLIYIAFIKIQALQWRPFNLQEISESRYQEIVILSDNSHKIIYTGGRFFYSYPDYLRDETDVHTAMTLHQAPRRILLIGGMPSVLREFFKYPVQVIDLIEMDQLIIKTLEPLLSKDDRPYLEDSRLRIIIEDPRFIIRKLSERYDLIVLNTPEPVTALSSRFYTIEFFREIKRVLKDDGILFMRLSSAYGYISRPLQRLNGTIYNSLKKVFPYCYVSSEEYGIMIASQSQLDLNPPSLVKRFIERKISFNYFEPGLFYDIFSPLKTEMVKKRFSEISEINSDTAPVAYLYNLFFWSYSEKGILKNILSIKDKGVIVILIFIFGASLFLLKRPVHYTIFTTGYTTIAFSVILILLYQTSYGYIYERIGLLSSFFMLGLAAGSWIFSQKKSLNDLRFSELLFVCLILLSIYLMRYELSFYLASLLSGFLGGLQFSISSNILKERKYPSALLYAIDLGGSFIGAFLTTIYLVPLMGTENSLFILSIIKISSLASALRNEKA
ncbi:MAG: hypothetical protein ACK4TF_01975 [Thermodesulfovibrionales bacterium]